MMVHNRMNKYFDHVELLHHHCRRRHRHHYHRHLLDRLHLAKRKRKWGLAMKTK